MEWIFPFTTTETPEPAQAGGKGMSLIHTTRQGLPVPVGLVLAVAFFQPWLEAIRATPEWAWVLAGSPEEWGERCVALQKLAMGLPLDPARREALAQALQALKGDEAAPLFAVRSSSPEEDLEGASFAGGYETVLGVNEAGIEDALRRAFASCLDARVLLYKKEHGYAVDEPRIAVIVQKQVAAQAAGVAFSLNPANNCYDEAVINANFGLGESVVSGLVSPDAFVVDKVSRTILEKKVGSKETSVWLAPAGGTYREPAPDRAQLCLTDEQVLALTAMLARVESYYRKPVDVEWALAEGRLYLLQARPITAYIPLPDVLRTAPGEPKQLYVDMTLTKWGMQESMSVLGLDHLDLTSAALHRNMLGDIGPEELHLLRLCAEGRTYQNLSNMIKLMGKQKTASTQRAMDTLVADIIENIADEEYVPKKLPTALKGLVFKAIRQNLRAGWRTLQAYRKPKVYMQEHLQEIERFRQGMERLAAAGEQLSLREFTIQTINRLMRYVNMFMSGLYAAEIARIRLKGIFKGEPPEVRDRVIYLERALPNNDTIEMGLSMYRLASLPEILACASWTEFAAKLQAGEFSAGFLAAWDAFMADYGFRSPMEMDAAAPRFYDEPERLFAQLRAMATNTGPRQNPQAIYERARSEREATYRELLQIAEKKGRRKAAQFRKNYEVLVALGGFRETGKYLYVLVTDMFRRRVLAIAGSLVEAGRLDRPQQVFDLTLADLERGMADPSVDLRALAAASTRYQERVRHIREFPRVIDSRGKILRPPRKEAGAGELVGEPISPGTVRGPVKVLHRADEKPILPGEILVARATDPGWTPLFINAGGIILEVGGLLQHGALVAREYGKPCIAGIDGATSLLNDGQMVELDGAGGIVRLVE